MILIENHFTIDFQILVINRKQEMANYSQWANYFKV